ACSPLVHSRAFPPVLRSFPTRRSSDLHRHDRGAGLGGNEGRAFIHFHECTGGGDAALWKDHHGTARLDQPDDLLDRHRTAWVHRDRKSTRLNSSHVKSSYAAFLSKIKM